MTLAKKITLIILSIIAIGTVSVTAFGMRVYLEAQRAMEKSYTPIATAAEAQAKVQRVQATEPISILLMGLDTGGVGREEKFVGRSDTMMVVTINPTKEQTTIVSLDRDALVSFGINEPISIPDVGTLSTFSDKLNHTFAYGEAALTISTVEKLLDIDITYYAAMNFQGLSDLVDAVGGIHVNNKLGEFTVEDGPTYKVTVPAGEQVMSGKIALAYARMRYDDPEGDVGRQRRQREVVEKIVDRLLSANTLTNFQNVFNAVSQNMITDVRFGTMTDIAESYRAAANNIKSYQLVGIGQQLNGTYFQILPAQSILEISNVLRVQMHEPEITELNPQILTWENQMGFAAPVIFDITTGREKEVPLEIDNTSQRQQDVASGY
ncbi:MAG: LCP family protein [Streptococcaceae bacterium]|jgi:LCP family protein required for cell wall assembly|nr:LCP family protein [Streptococcaceae bacterium]